TSRMSPERRNDGHSATPSRTHTQGKIMSNFLIALLICVGVLAVVGRADTPTSPASPKPDDKDKSKDKKPEFRTGAVRYQVKEVEFYTKPLGFKVEQQFGAGAPFASVSNGGLTLWLSGPKSSGARAMPDGRKQEPGGWNRIVLAVDDLPSRVEAMKKAGLRFR